MGVKRKLIAYDDSQQAKSQELTMTDVQYSLITSPFETVVPLRSMTQ